MSWRRVQAPAALRDGIILSRSSRSYQTVHRPITSHQTVLRDKAGKPQAESSPKYAAATRLEKKPKARRNNDSQRSRLTEGRSPIFKRPLFRSEAVEHRADSSPKDDAATRKEETPEVPQNHGYPSSRMTENRLRLQEDRLCRKAIYKEQQEAQLRAESLGTVQGVEYKKVEPLESVDNALKERFEAYLRRSVEASSGASRQVDDGESLQNMMDSPVPPARRTNKPCSNEPGETESSTLVKKAALDVLLAEWETAWQSNLRSDSNEEERSLMEMMSPPTSRVPITTESIQPILNFLQSPQSTDANLNSFANWLSKRHPTEETTRAFLTLVGEIVPPSGGKYGLIAAIVANLMRCKHPKSVDGPVMSYLDALPRDQLFQGLCASTVEKLCVAELGVARTDVVPETVKRWFDVLKSLPQGVADHTWRVQYRALLKRVNSLSTLQAYFSTMSHSNIAWSLLRGWVFRLPAASSPTARVATHREPGEPSPMDLYISLKESRADVLRKFEDIQNDAAYEPGTQDSLVEMIGLLRAKILQKSAVDDMACDILGLLLCIRKPGELKVFYDRMRDHPLVELTPKFRILLIQHYISIGQSYYAWHVFNHSPALVLDSSCFELPLLMIEEGKIGSAAIMEMLTGKHSGSKQHNTWIELAPPAFHRLTRSDKARTPEHKQTLTELVDLVHLMALAWAESPHVSDRESFRRVQECYRFLRDRGIPPRRSIIRALVTASLVRVVRRTGRGLVLTKAQYVVNLIRRSEGDTEAMLFEEQLQNLLSETAVHQEILVKELATDARKRAVKAMEPEMRALDYRRRKQRAKQRVLLAQKPPFFKGKELDKRGPPKSLVKLPDGSLLNDDESKNRIRALRANVRSSDVTFGYGE